MTRGTIFLGLMVVACSFSQTADISELKHKAEMGEAAAEYQLGTMYFQGQGVPQDYAEAMRWYRKAADQGDAGAQGTIGAMYCFGQGVPQSYAEAMRWYRKAADQGNAAGQQSVGAMYFQG
jgi:TPR repeat protein